MNNVFVVYSCLYILLAIGAFTVPADNTAMEVHRLVGALAAMFVLAFLLGVRVPGVVLKSASVALFLSLLVFIGSSAMVAVEGINEGWSSGDLVFFIAFSFGWLCFEGPVVWILWRGGFRWRLVDGQHS